MKALAIRFSSMGDVALVAAAAKAWLNANQKNELLVCSRPQFKPLFEPLERCEFFPADVSKDYKGLHGMKMLADHLVNHFDFDYVADLHDSIRSRILCTFLRFQGFQISRINKGRSEKQKLTRKKNKQLYPLIHTIERYLEALPGNVHWNDHLLPVYTSKLKNFHSGNLKVGLAPYAKHPVKQWPEPKFFELIDMLKNDQIECVIFGSQAEREKFRKRFSKNEHFIQIPEIQSLGEEIQLMFTLDAFVALDSFNMHLAYLCGLPVVSIWGPTHPYIGFGPLGPSKNFIVQIELDCRPCSTYGQKKCFRGDHACMELISTEQVLQQIKNAIKTRKRTSQ